MNEQEKMRKWIVKNIIEVCASHHKGGVVTESECRDYAYKYKGDSCRYCTTDQILKYQASRGVVMKADRELPEPPEDGNLFGYLCGQADMFGAGYVAVEPLTS